MNVEPSKKNKGHNNLIDNKLSAERRFFLFQL